MGRTLSKRQRQLLQDYANDVEGRHPAPQTTSTPQPPEGSAETPLTGDDNGMDSFTYSPPPSGGRISRIWKNIRGLTGL